MSDSDKQALLDGTATIQTEIVVHNENLFDLTSISMSTGSATLNNGEISLTWTVGFNLDLQKIVSNLDTTKTYTLSFKHKGNSLFLRNKSVNPDTNILQTENDTDYTSYSLSLTNISGFEFRFVRRNTTGTAYIKDIRIEEGTPTILTEENSVIDWNHEDFRQVKEEGWVGQFVARQVTGNLHNLDDDFKITDKELELKLGVRTNSNTNWYSLGNFLVTKVTDDEVNDKTNFEALDYTKKFNKAYEDTIEYPCTALQLAQNVCAQCGVALGSVSFRNDDYAITGNVFTNNESCRDVMKAIGKLAFSWVRVDWDNKVYIDFDPTPFKGSTTPSQYNTFGNNKYYNLKTQKEVFGPVDKVIIGYSAIEGERTYIGSEDGTCVINIFDNPLVFNQEQRASIIESASDLLGMTYTPLNTLTVGHPWLKGNELVRVVDMEGVSHDTIPLDRTIQYFGHIKTLINSNVETKTNDNLAYKPEMSKNYERSEIYNDQVKKQIGLIIEEQGNTNNRLNETISTLDGTIQRVSKTETSITDITTTTQSSIGKNSLYLEDAMEGNVLSYSVDGVCEQDTYSGKNLYNVNDKKDTWNNITSDKDGWITLNINNTGSSTAYRSFYTNVSGNLQTNTDYWVVLEIKGTKSYTGSNSNIDFVSSYTGNAKSQFSIGYRLGINNSSLVNGAVLKQKVTTRSDFTDCLTMTRSIIEVPTNSSCTLTFRMSIVKDEPNIDNFIYEKYVGGTPSPNPDFPQEIKTIPSIVNLCGIPDQTFTHNGVLVTIKDGEITLDGTATASGTKNLTPIKATTLQAQQYTLSKNYISGSMQNDTGQSNFNVRNSSSSSFIFSVTLQESKKSYTFSSVTSIIFGIYVYTGVVYNNYKFKLMLEEGTVAHEYIPYGYYTRVKITGKNLFDEIWENGGINSSNGSNESNGDALRIRTRNYISVLPSTKYMLSFDDTEVGTRNARIVLYDQNKNFINTLWYDADKNGKWDFITTNNTYYIRFTAKNSTTNWDLENIKFQLEEGSTSTSYEPYKEKEVLIDLSKENLIDIDELTFKNGYYSSTGEWNNANTNGCLEFIKVSSSTTYTITKNTKTDNMSISEFNESKTFIKRTQIYNSKTNTFTTDSTTNYIAITYNLDNSTTMTKSLFESWNIQLFKGTSSTPYYELCSNKDKTVKDRLLVDTNGNCSITKYIGKRVFNGSETITLINSNTDNWYYKITTNNPTANQLTQLCSHYENKGIYNGNTDNGIMLTNNGLETRIRFGTQDTINNYKNWLSNNNVTLQYELATPETITLPNTKIPLFEGINHITLIDDLETDTSVVYYRKTPLSGTYATLTQLNEVSTEKTQEIQTVRQEVLTEITNESLRIDVVRQEIDETGVPILNTGTGYTFDLDGLKMEKTDQDVKSQLDNDGLSVKYKNEDVLTARSNGVNAVNMTVNKFYIQKPIRMEKTKSISDSTQTGLGFFYIGE